MFTHLLFYSLIFLVLKNLYMDTVYELGDVINMPNSNFFGVFLCVPGKRVSIFSLLTVRPPSRVDKL